MNPPQPHHHHHSNEDCSVHYLSNVKSGQLIRIKKDIPVACKRNNQTLTLQYEVEKNSYVVFLKKKKWPMLSDDKCYAWDFSFFNGGGIFYYYWDMNFDSETDLNTVFEIIESSNT